MEKETIRRANHTIRKILYITLATSDRRGEPWNTTIYEAVPKRFWINSMRRINGQPADIREEIKLK